MSAQLSPIENRVAVLVDWDNTTPAILEYGLRMVAQFGRVILRRGYGNHTTLTNKWQEALVRLAFTPCLQFQYATGKNTADIALALDALEARFDKRAENFGWPRNKSCFLVRLSCWHYLARKPIGRLKRRLPLVCCHRLISHLHCAEVCPDQHSCNSGFSYIRRHG